MESKISFLQSVGLLDDHVDFLSRLLEIIEGMELPEDILMNIKDHFRNPEDLSFAYMHFYILMQYLSHRFKVNNSVVKKMFRIKGMPSWKPLSTYPLICDLIVNDFNVDISDIMDHTELLSMDLVDVLKILRACPKIAGMRYVDIAKLHPTLLAVPFDKLIYWCKLFENYNVTRLLITPKLIKLLKSDVTLDIEERLKILSKRPEFEVFAFSEKFVDVLQIEYPIKRVVEIAHSGKAFIGIDKAVKSSYTSLCDSRISTEMASYIASELNVNEDEKDKYAEIRALRTELGIVNTKEVLKLLMGYGFSSEQILNGIQVLSYDYTELKSALDKFSDMPNWKEWMRNPNVIHLFCYLILKDGVTR